MDYFSAFVHTLSEQSVVLAALSGGADSVCLLHRLYTLPGRTFSLRAAHFNHALRGAESEGDEAFVRALCAAWGISLSVERRPVGELAGEWGVSVEEAGRRARYEWFEQLLGEDPNRVLVTAHTASDQGETLLFRMARGTSLAGLGGIPFRRGRIYRPLLGWTGQQTRAYCAAHELGWREDSSNQSMDYARNRLRQTAMPALRRENPQADFALSRLAADCREDEEFLSAQARLALDGAKSEYGWNAEKLGALPPALRRRAAALLLEKENVPRTHESVCRLTELFFQSGRRQIGRTVFAASRGTLGVVPAKRIWEPVPLQPGRFVLPGGRAYEIQRIDIDSPKNLYTFFREPVALFLDCGKISNGAVFRQPHAGDGFSPAGRGCRKTLKNLFWEAKIPSWRRQSRWVLEDALGIAAAEDFGADTRAVPTAQTKTVWKIEPIRPYK